MPVRQVQPGQRLRQSAADHNAMANAANWVAAHGQGQTFLVDQTAREPDRVWVYNSECGDWQRFDAIQLTRPVVDPACALEAWAGGDPQFHAQTPADHRGRIAILLEPCDPCAMARAVVSGAVQTRVQITSTAHRYATPSGRTLVSTDDPAAPCQILWPTDQTGTVYAVVRLSNGDAESTTSTAAGQTTTTPPPCSGSCKWTWSASTLSWTLESSTCGAAPTPTTPAPTTSTTDVPTSTSTSTTCACSTTAAPTTTSAGATTTTLPPCSCLYPTYCGDTDGECTYTNCAQAQNYPPYCSPTTTATPTTCDCNTSTTGTTPAPCALGCDWVGVPTADGWAWQQTSNGCTDACPCEAPAGDPFCATAHTECVLLPPTTQPPPPPGCGGACTWWYVPALGQWVKTDDGCADVPNCNCPPPTIPGTVCAATSTPCATPTTPAATTTTLAPCANCYTSSTAVPTTTTAAPCDSGRCKWQGSPTGDWTLVESSCPYHCPCSRPAHDAQNDCEVAWTPCAGTTTTEPPTTTSTTGTSTTAGPCTCLDQGCLQPSYNNSTWLCQGGTWVLCASNCPPGEGGSPPATACAGGDCFCATGQCEPTTSTTTTSDTPTTPPPTGVCCCDCGFSDGWCSDMTAADCAAACGDPCSSNWYESGTCDSRCPALTTTTPGYSQMLAAAPELFGVNLVGTAPSETYTVAPQPGDEARRWRWITTAEFYRDLRQVALALPRHVSGVAGVPRGGMLAASYVASLLNLPLYGLTRDGLQLLSSSGRRLRESEFSGPLVVMDDDVYSGGTIRAALANMPCEYITAAAYQVTFTHYPLDYVARQFPCTWFREWAAFATGDWFNSRLATDFDGVLCHDCTPEQDDDGDKYREFLQTARPLYAFAPFEIPLIVTARLEAYRHQTEAWLAAQGLQARRLVMGPWKSIRQRTFAKVVRLKASTWDESGLKFFVESDPIQAAHIAALVHRPVICSTTGQVFNDTARTEPEAP